MLNILKLWCIECWKMQRRNALHFRNRWQRVTLGLFVVAWSVMLLPMLFAPDSVVAKFFMFGLLGVGAVAINVLLFDALARRHEVG